MAKLLIAALVVNMFRKEHVSSAGWAADDHGDVWVFCARGVCELQVSNGDHVKH